LMLQVAYELGGAGTVLCYYRQLTCQTVVR
jgi:hypothetical protein